MSDTPAETLAKAKLLIKATEQALADGTKHYDVNGNPLNTVKEVLAALTRDGKIEFEPRRTNGRG